MRVHMSFVMLSEPEQPPQKVFTGPAWATEHTQEVFVLMELGEGVAGGTVSLERFAAGLTLAKRTLHRLAPQYRPRKVEIMLAQLATWATIAKIKGANALQWREDV